MPCTVFGPARVLRIIQVVYAELDRICSKLDFRLVGRYDYLGSLCLGTELTSQKTFLCESPLRIIRNLTEFESIVDFGLTLDEKDEGSSHPTQSEWLVYLFDALVKPIVSNRSAMANECDYSVESVSFAATTAINGKDRRCD